MTKRGLFEAGLCRNTTQPSQDTARGAPATRCPAPTTRPVGTCDTAGWGLHYTCALAGPGWVLCALNSVLTQFLDSVLFLSHCLDTVHEHCSSQKKKLKKKLNK